MERTATLGAISDRITEIDALVFRGNTGQIAMTVEQRTRLEEEAAALMEVLAKGLHDAGAGTYQFCYDERVNLRSAILIAATTARYAELHPQPQPEIDAIVAEACKDHSNQTPEQQQQGYEKLAAIFGTVFVELPSEAVSSPARRGFLARLLHRQ